MPTDDDLSVLHNQLLASITLAKTLILSAESSTYPPELKEAQEVARSIGSRVTVELALLIGKTRGRLQQAKSEILDYNYAHGRTGVANCGRWSDETGHGLAWKACFEVCRSATSAAVPRFRLNDPDDVAERKIVTPEVVYDRWNHVCRSLQSAASDFDYDRLRAYLIAERRIVCGPINAACSTSKAPRLCTEGGFKGIAVGEERLPLPRKQFEIIETALRLQKERGFICRDDMRKALHDDDRNGEGRFNKAQRDFNRLAARFGIEIKAADDRKRDGRMIVKGWAG